MRKEFTNNSDSNRNFYRFKCLLLVAVMLLMGHAGFSNEIYLKIYPPLDDNGDIIYYCVEYRVNDPRTGEVGEWMTFDVYYDEVDILTRGFTSCVLADLTPDTFYEIRVHPCYLVDGEPCWGLYGSPVIVLSNTIVHQNISGGVLDYPGDPDHPDLELELMFLLPCTGVLYRRREEEEMAD